MAGSVAVVGCGGKSQTSKDPKPTDEKKKKIPPPQTIGIINGSGLYRNPKNEPLWKVNWKTGEVTLSQKNLKSQANDVSGEIYKAAQTACTFTALKGSVDKDNQILTLTENVKLLARNPAATLFCDRMVYEGKLKIVKAFGHVRALGTTDTTGTIDELWATPDLKKLATPDMFNRLIAAAPMLMTAIPASSSQSVFHLADGKGMDVQAHSLSRVTSGSKVNYVLQKLVHVTSTRQGLSLQADSVTAQTIVTTAVAAGKDQKGELLSTATAIGKVVFDKMVTTPEGKQTTHITGSKADYTDGATESTVKLAGPVTILNVDAGRGQTLKASGASGTAYLDRFNKASSGTGLHRATLQGGVKIDVDRRKTAKQEALSLTATSDRALIDNIGESQRITLLGNVHIQGSSVGTSSGISKSVITIDKDGNIKFSAVAP